MGRPSAIQASALPVLLAGRNAVIAAETGCGKTHAYLTAIAHHHLRGYEDVGDLEATAMKAGTGRSEESRQPGSGIVSDQNGSELHVSSDSEGSEERRRDGAGGSAADARTGGPTQADRKGMRESQNGYLKSDAERGSADGGSGSSSGWQRRSGGGSRGGGGRGGRGGGHRFSLVLCPNAALCRQVMSMALQLRGGEGEGEGEGEGMRGNKQTSRPLLSVEAVVGGEVREGEGMGW